MKQILYILVLLLLLSCEKTLTDFELKEKDAKIVLIGWAEADSTPNINLTRSMSLNEPIDIYSLNNGDVRIYPGGGDEQIKLVNDKPGYYVAPYFIFQEGVEYRIEASVEGYESVSANFTVPEKPNIRSVNTSFIKKQNSFGEQWVVMNVELTVDAEKGMDEYYELYLSGYGYKYTYDDNYNVVDSTLEEFVKQIYAQSASIGVERSQGDYYTLGAPDMEMIGEYFYLHDKFSDGEVFKFNFETTISNGFLDEVSEVLDMEFMGTLHLSRIDKNIYEYAVSRGKNSEAEGNPFVEPVSIYTNVEEGLGIIGGKTTTCFELDVREVILEKKSPEI